MLPREEAEPLFARALAELASDWEMVGGLVEVNIREPNHWLSGIGTFGATLRHRATGAIKVLGRRSGSEPGATYHRGISFLVLEAYAERNTDPIRRYLEEVGVAGRRSVFGQRPLAVFRVR
jgi:hypothetical protein